MVTGNELYKNLQPYLRPDEQVLWMGKPAIITGSKGSKFTVMFSLFFMGFAVFWMLMASMAGGFFFLFGLPFLLVGAWIFYSSTVGHKNKLKTCIYAVTDTRAIILLSLRSGMNFNEYVFANLSGVSLENVRDGAGTIRFEDVNVYHYDYGRHGRRMTYYPDRELTTGFVMINNVHEVYHMISDRIGK